MLNESNLSRNVPSAGELPPSLAALHGSCAKHLPAAAWRPGTTSNHSYGATGRRGRGRAAPSFLGTDLQRKDQHRVDKMGQTQVPLPFSSCKLTEWASLGSEGILGTSSIPTSPLDPH